MSLHLLHANKVAVSFWTAGAIILIARFFHIPWIDPLWYPTFFVSGAIVYVSYIIGLTIENAARDIVVTNRDRDMQEISRVVGGYIASSERLITEFEKAAESE
jgi:hypothetical protein